MLPFVESRPSSNYVNRPVFQRGLCSTFRLLFQGRCLLTECILLFVRRLAADHPVQRFLVVPVDPFRCFPSKLSGSFPEAEVLDYLGLEQSDASFGQGVVVAVSDAFG